MLVLWNWKDDDDDDDGGGGVGYVLSLPYGDFEKYICIGNYLFV